MGQLGVIGLGHIGGAIAANLIADGHRVIVYDLDRSRAEAVTGAEVAPDVTGVARKAEITLTSLPGPEAVSGVAADWAAAAAPDAVLVDLSTTSPAVNREIEGRLLAGGLHFVEAPVSGGAPGAQQRTLVFMMGGTAVAVERCRPLLESLGRATFHLGPVGTGTTMKLVNSLLAFTCSWVSLEGLSLAERAGLDLRSAVEVVRTAGASNFYIDRAVEGIDQRHRPAQFSLALAAKDAGLIAEATDAHAVPAPVAHAMVAVLQAALDGGLGDRDWSDLVELAELQAGVELRLGPSGVAPA